mmetsp:Transcript_22642/g.33228  ORF Transcript_22642/g.33228 Transcript_22642/m.33228 type:complete len:373 (-) Transcript_22642:59-1177(-)
MYYDHPLNGDLHEIVPGKFIAFKGPIGAPWRTKENEYSLSPESYLLVFKEKNVNIIVRLNEAAYSRKCFLKNGIDHLNLFFGDCTSPPDSIVHKFLVTAENCNGVIAIHCLAGLGRTGTLIALYLMKHYLFTAREAISWLRIARPGSIIGPQQKFLVRQEARMHRLGRSNVVGLGVHGATLIGGEWEVLEEDEMIQDDCGVELVQELSRHMADMVTQSVQHRLKFRLLEARVGGVFETNLSGDIPEDVVVDEAKAKASAFRFVAGPSALSYSALTAWEQTEWKGPPSPLFVRKQPPSPPSVVPPSLLLAGPPSPLFVRQQSCPLTGEDGFLGISSVPSPSDTGLAHQHFGSARSDRQKKKRGKRAKRETLQD